MTMANAKQVSRHECTVEEVTSTSMTLFIPDKLYGNPHLYKPLIVRNGGATNPQRSSSTRKSSTKAARAATDTTPVVSLQGAAPVPSQRFTLYVGDCLIFQTGQGFEDHPFQVVAMATTTTTTTPTTTASLPRKRAAAAPTSRVVSDTIAPRHHKPTKTLDPSSLVPSVPPPPLRTNNNKANNKAKTNHHKKTKTTHSLQPNVPWLPVGATPFICPFDTNYITHHTDRLMIQSSPLSPSPRPLLRDGQDNEEPPPSWGGSTATLDTTSRTEVPPATTTTIMTTANVAQVDSNNNADKEKEEVDDDYYDDEDDDDEAEDPSTKNTPRDMHTTLGNTLQKALCESTTPTMGATLLRLTTLHHHRLPSLQLCQALIHQSSLLDCGSTTSNHSEGVSLVAQRLILEYFQDAVDKYPTVLPKRLVAAAGPTVWRTLLDLLASLPPPPVLPPSPKQPRQALSSSRSSRRGASSNTTSPTEEDNNKRKEDEETSRRHRHRHHRHHRECLLHYQLMEKHLVALKFLYLVMDGAVHTSTIPGSQTTTTPTGSAASGSTNITSNTSPPCRRTRRTNNHSNITTGKQPSSSSPLLSSSPSSSSSMILLKDMRDFGSAAACRLAASTMAHVLCVLGPEHLLPSQQQEEDDEDELTMRVVFHSVASDIMEYLGWMLRFMVQELLLFPSTSSSTTDSPMKDTNVATLLWDALSSRLDDDSYSSRYAAAGSGGSSTTTRKSKSLTTIEKRNLKIYWLECFVGGRQQQEEAEHDESQQLQSPDRRRQGMIDMEEILAAKLRITKEYFE